MPAPPALSIAGSVATTGTRRMDNLQVGLLVGVTVALITAITGYINSVTSTHVALKNTSDIKDLTATAAVHDTQLNGTLDLRIKDAIDTKQGEQVTPPLPFPGGTKT